VTNDGNGTTTPAGASVRTKSVAVAIVATPKTGYPFVNWSVTSGSANFGNANSASTTVTANEDVTIRANFVINTYTVTFDLAGKGTRTGGGALTQTVNYGSAAIAPVLSANAGWTFNGWDTPFANVTTNRTVTAKWIPGPPVIGEIGRLKAMVGVQFMLPLTVESESSPVKSVTVSGLPAGLKYDPRTKTIKGVPTVPVTGREVKVTAKNEFRTPDVLIFIITVDPLPIWASGMFNGSCVVDNDSGTATMSVTALGIVTGKLSVGGITYRFSAPSYDIESDLTTEFFCTTVATAGKEVFLLKFKVTKPAGIAPPSLSIAESWFATPTKDDPDVKLYRNVWKDDNVDIMTKLEPYVGYYTAVLPGGAVHGSGYLTITVNKVGSVKIGGKLADGMVHSLSGTLILDETGRIFTVIYTSPLAYQKGCMFGLAEFVKPQDGAPVFLRLLDDIPFRWENRNSQATAVYDGGFDRELGLTGGSYDKTGNLYDYYLHKVLTAAVDADAADPELAIGVNSYGSVIWDFSGVLLTPVLNSFGEVTGLAAPKAGLPANPLGLQIRLNCATGVFNGSFKAYFDYGVTHNTSKSISYEGVLTPEREDKEDGIEARGFFLWADKAQHINQQGNPVTYPFKWSYDFIIHSEKK
jgi:hypothetical protein